MLLFEALARRSLNFSVRRDAALREGACQLPALRSHRHAGRAGSESANAFGHFGGPVALKIATSLVLHSSRPSALLVGDDGIAIYNDAYAALIGLRHPAA